LPSNKSHLATSMTYNCGVWSEVRSWDYVQTELRSASTSVIAYPTDARIDSSDSQINWERERGREARVSLIELGTQHITLLRCLQDDTHRAHWYVDRGSLNFVSVSHILSAIKELVHLKGFRNNAGTLYRHTVRTLSHTFIISYCEELYISNKIPSFFRTIRRVKLSFSSCLF
jgi:hypothetical protein